MVSTTGWFGLQLLLTFYPLWIEFFLRLWWCRMIQEPHKYKHHSYHSILSNQQKYYWLDSASAEISTSSIKENEITYLLKCPANFCEITRCNFLGRCKLSQLCNSLFTLWPLGCFLHKISWNTNQWMTKCMTLIKKFVTPEIRCNRILAKKI